LRRRAYFLTQPSRALCATLSAAQGVLTYMVNEIRGPGRRLSPLLDGHSRRRIRPRPRRSDAHAVDGGRHFKHGKAIQFPSATTTSAAAGSSRRAPPRSGSETCCRWTGSIGAAGLDASVSRHHGRPSCRSWKPGVAMDMTKFRKKDDDYWEQYRATPKFFISLEPGTGPLEQSVWRSDLAARACRGHQRSGDGAREIARAESGLLISAGYCCTSESARAASMNPTTWEACFSR
jgi:hypothetical protein